MWIDPLKKSSIFGGLGCRAVKLLRLLDAYGERNYNTPLLVQWGSISVCLGGPVAACAASSWSTYPGTDGHISVQAEPPKLLITPLLQVACAQQVNRPRCSGVTPGSRQHSWLQQKYLRLTRTWRNLIAKGSNQSDYPNQSFLEAG